MWGIGDVLLIFVVFVYVVLLCLCVWEYSGLIFLLWVGFIDFFYFVNVFLNKI